MYLISHFCIVKLYIEIPLILEQRINIWMANNNEKQYRSPSFIIKKTKFYKI